MTEDIWLDHCPRVRPDLLVSAGVLRGARRIHLIKDLESDRAFEVGEKEHFIVARLDGRTTLRAIGEDYAGRFGRRIDSDGWTEILGQLHRRSLLVDETVATASEGDRIAAPSKQRRSTPLRGDLVIARDPGRAVEQLHAWLRWTLSAWVVVPVVVVLVATEVLLLTRLSDLLDLLGEALRDPVTILLVLLTLWVSAALHEIAHGVVARHFGGIVTALGVRWRLPVIFLYCRVENYMFLRRRWHQVATALAGTYANLLVLLPAVVVWLAWDAPDGVDAYLVGVLLLGSLLGLTNLLPVAPLDGYAALSQALGVSGLAAESRVFTGAAVRHLLGRGPDVRAYPLWARVTYLSYALGSTVLMLALGVAVVLLGAAELPESWGDWRVALPIALVVTAFAGSAAAQQVRRDRR